MHQDTTLISIGFVSEYGRCFYAEFTDYDKTQLNDWLEENVISNLYDYNITELNNKSDYEYHIGDTEYIKEKLIKWLGFYDSVEMWSDCLAYDWVLFNNIFGSAFDIPENVYYIPFDICTLFKIKGIDPDISREEFVGCSKKAKHNALFDAEVILKCYNKLLNM